MKYVKKSFSVAGNILFYAFLACLIAYLVMSACGIRPFITMSGSMEPNIHTGSLCFVNTKAEYRDIREQDIIAFRTPMGDLVTHRVISITKDGMETQGDANDVSDGVSTTRKNFYGKTLFSIPYLGYGVAALQQTRNKLIVIVVAAAIFLMGLVGDNKDEEQENNEKASEGETANDEVAPKDVENNIT